MKTESHREFWWSKVRCECGVMMDAQKWCDGFYRISCDGCGAAFISVTPDGLNGQDGEK